MKRWVTKVTENEHVFSRETGCLFQIHNTSPRTTTKHWGGGGATEASLRTHTRKNCYKSNKLFCIDASRVASRSGTHHVTHPVCIRLEDGSFLSLPPTFHQRHSQNTDVEVF